MSTVLSLALIIAGVLGSEWLIDHHLGEAARTWIFFGGLGLMAVAYALMQASGVTELMRILRRALLGAHLGAVLRGLGLDRPWLKRALRLIGIETDPQAPSDKVFPGRFGTWLLTAGWASSLIALGMLWTGAAGG